MSGPASTPRHRATGRRSRCEAGTVVIAGAGLAGARCAETLRAEGFEGRIVLVGDEPTAPYERPALSKELLAGRRTSVELRPRGWWAAQGVELLLGRRVERIDPVARTAALSSGAELAWGSFVIATGARPRRVPGARALRTLAEARSLAAALRPGRRLLMIGAGFVGAEVASTAVALGVDVTLVEAGPVPFVRTLGEEVGSLLAARYVEHGVDLRVGARAKRLERHDVVVAGIGVEPCGDLLARGAIATDACGRTQLPGVYACGDVAAWWRPSLGRHVRVEHWTSAAGQGAAVARAILGGDEAFDEVPFFWSDQFGLRLQHIGHADRWQRVELQGEPDRFVARYVDSSGRTLAVLLANRPDQVGAVRRELAEAA
jgi:3-phenylpropionate/trans-cinnamate dioxygenase ferredoxin reductase subunit